VADRALAVRQDAAGDPRQRDARALPRRAHPALSLARVRRVGRVHRPRRDPVGAAQRPGHPRRPVLAAVGQDRVLRRAGRIPHLHRADRRRGGVQLPRGVRRGPDRVLAARARRGAHPSRHLLARLK
jgi:hypothetical protein